MTPRFSFPPCSWLSDICPRAAPCPHCLLLSFQFILLLWGRRAGLCGSEDAARKCPCRFPLLYDLSTMGTVLYWVSWALHNMASELPDMDGQVCSCICWTLQPLPLMLSYIFSHPPSLDCHAFTCSESRFTLATFHSSFRYFVYRSLHISLRILIKI